MPKSRRLTEEDRRIGRDLAEIRKRCKVTQKEIAEHVKKSPQQISKYERGIDRVPASIAEQMKEYYRNARRSHGFEETPQSPYETSISTEAALNLLPSQIEAAIEILRNVLRILEELRQPRLQPG